MEKEPIMGGADLTKAELDASVERERALDSFNEACKKANLDLSEAERDELVASVRVEEGEKKVGDYESMGVKYYYDKRYYSIDFRLFEKNIEIEAMRTEEEARKQELSYVTFTPNREEHMGNKVRYSHEQCAIDGKGLSFDVTKKIIDKYFDVMLAAFRLKKVQEKAEREVSDEREFYEKYKPENIERRKADEYAARVAEKSEKDKLAQEKWGGAKEGLNDHLAEDLLK